MLFVRPQQLQKLLCFVSLLLLPHSTTYAVLYDAFQDPNECTGSDYQLCGCQAVPEVMMPDLRTLLSQPVDCEQLCSQRTCQQTCEQSVCSYPMGDQGQLCTTALLDEALVSYVRNSECSFDEDMRTYRCEKGSSVAYPDEQTYTAITKGYCLPSCNLQIEKFSCIFSPMFREETHIDPADLPEAPFVQIFGVAFADLQEVPGESTTTPTVTDPKTAVSEDETVTTTAGDTTKAGTADAGKKPSTGAGTDTESTGSGSGETTTTSTGSGSGETTTTATGSGSGDTTKTGSGSGDTTKTGSGSGDTTKTGSGSGDTTTATGSGSGDTTKTGSGSGDTTTTSTGSGSGDTTTTSTGSGSGDTTTTTKTGSGSGETTTATGRGSGETTTATGSGSGAGSDDQAGVTTTSTGSGSGETTTATGSGSGAGSDDQAGVTTTSTGSGSGDTTSTGSGSGDTTKTGSGSGDTTKTGSGSGDTTKTGSGSGDTTKTGSGSGDTTKTGSGSGDTTKTGSGSGAGSDDQAGSSKTGSGVGDTTGTDSGTDQDSDLGSDTFSFVEFGTHEEKAETTSLADEPEKKDDPKLKTPVVVAPPSEAPVEAPPSEASVEAPPSEAPVEEPTAPPSEAPIEEPFAPPSDAPIEEPVASPSEAPIEEPFAPPSDAPIEEPVTGPEVEPQEPSAEEDTEEPTKEPTGKPVEEFPSSTNNFKLYYGPYGECPQVCRQAGDNYQERSITCRDPAGIPAELNMCELPDDLPNRYFLKCQNLDCGPDYYIDLASWPTCPKKCTEIRVDGTSIPNIITRDYECKRVTDNSVVEQENCAVLLDELDVVLEAKCNSVPCDHYAYEVSEWGACSCETFKQERSLTCRHWTTGENVDVSICKSLGIEKPAVERFCFPETCSPTTLSRKLLQNDVFDFCAYTNCSTKGDCENGLCSCKNGFDGMDCQIDTRSKSKCPPPSLLNGNGDCCRSGIFDLSGKCCDGVNGETEIDIDGNCCTGKPLDGCGKCGGDEPHFQDAAGQCCAALDASGTCCTSGDVDECGVCDGYGKTCNTTLTFAVEVAEGSNLDSCVREVKSIVEDALAIEEGPLDTHLQSPRRLGFSKIGVGMTTGLIRFRVQQILLTKNPTRPCKVERAEPAKLAVCGNGVCEIDETNTCPKDCEYDIELCEMEEDLYSRLVMCNGHGQCSFVNTSSCKCNTGYTGPDCEDCESGFFHLEGDNRCIPGQAIANRPDSEIVPRTLGSPETDPTTVAVRTAQSSPADAEPSSGTANSNEGLEIGPILAIIGICLAVFIFVLIVFIVVRRRKHHDERELSDEQELNPEAPEGHPSIPSST